ncbi:MAG: hypothetical protein IJ165_12675 [Proteobacteria bacterium]|nr:hypothetical protein [Pseudomonadota bacterium]
MWADLARTSNAFALDLYQFFFNNTGYMLVLKEDNLCLLTYILHFLNSTTILFYHDITSSKLDVNGWRWFREFVEQLPIPMPNDEITSTITTLDAQLIDDYVCRIYCLTDEETYYIKRYRELLLQTK